MTFAYSCLCVAIVCGFHALFAFYEAIWCYSRFHVVLGCSVSRCACSVCVCAVCFAVSLLQESQQVGGRNFIRCRGGCLLKALQAGAYLTLRHRQEYFPWFGTAPMLAYILGKRTKPRSWAPHLRFLPLLCAVSAFFFALDLGASM